MKKALVTIAAISSLTAVQAIETLVITNLTVPGQTEIQRESFLDIEGGFTPADFISSIKGEVIWV